MGFRQNVFVFDFASRYPCGTGAIRFATSVASNIPSCCKEDISAIAGTNCATATAACGAHNTCTTNTTTTTTAAAASIAIVVA